VEVAGRGGPAEHAPDQGHPGHGLRQLQADLPERVDIIGGALDAEELRDVLLDKVLGVFGAFFSFRFFLGGGARGEGGVAAACSWAGEQGEGGRLEEEKEEGIKR